MSLIRRLAPRKDRARRGIAAMEFALMLPIWITLFLGCVDVASMMVVTQRVDRIAYTVTDILTQSKTLTIQDIDKTMLAAGELMRPFTFGSRGVVIVTSLYKPSGQATKISWQHTGGGGLARSSKIGLPGQTPSMPANLTLNDNENVLVAEVWFDFDPLFLNAELLTSGDVYRVAVYKPRLSPLITPPT